MLQIIKIWDREIFEEYKELFDRLEEYDKNLGNIKEENKRWMKIMK